MIKVKGVLSLIEIVYPYSENVSTYQSYENRGCCRINN